VLARNSLVVNDDIGVFGSAKDGAVVQEMEFLSRSLTSKYDKLSRHLNPSPAQFGKKYMWFGTAPQFTNGR